MDITRIKDIEKTNDGKKIHLFYAPAVDLWLAVDKSAFVLRLLLKSLDYENFRTYSGALNSPITVIGSATVERLRAMRHIKAWEPESYAELHAKEEFSEKDYARWLDKLKTEHESPLQINILTPPLRGSKNISKDGFIEDNMSGFSRNVKRLGDFFISSVALVAFSPLILGCYLLIKAEDKGPAIFRQERIGRFGKPFHIYKFRSMRMDAEKFGPQLSHHSGKSDPRLTKVGRFLRAHHLDELPQLWNVFTGDMAFIGPRPERKYFIDQIMEYDKRYTYLYQIRPGVTSLATLYNGYTDTMEKMLRRLEYDLYYLGNRSWLLDFKILVKTFLKIVFGKKF